VSDDRVKVNAISNEKLVEVTTPENKVIVTDKKQDTSVNIIQKETSVVTIISEQPLGSIGLSNAQNKVIVTDKKQDTFLITEKETSVITIGAAGPKGDKGNQGDKGDKGDPGTLQLNSLNGEIIITGSLLVSGSVGQNVTINQNLIVSGTITSPGSDRQIIFNDGGVLGSDSGFVFDVNERLGIGTSTPTNTLQVVGGITATSLTGSINASNVIGLNLSRISTGSITASVNIGADAFKVQSGSSTFFTINSSSQAGLGPGITVPEGEFGLSIYNTFYTPHTVIVGTDSPVAPSPATSSVVIGGTNAQLDLYNPNSSVSADVLIGAIRFRNNDTSLFGITKAQIAAYATDTTPDGYLVFSTQQNASPSGLAERMRITNTGLVGIGTTSPTERLHVDGNMIVTGRITAEEFHTEFISSSIIYQSGSTQFGNSLDDTHQFTGSLSVNGSITGSLLGTASFATSASFSTNVDGGFY